MSPRWPFQGFPLSESSVSPQASGYYVSNRRSSYSAACSCPAGVCIASLTHALASAVEETNRTNWQQASKEFWGKFQCNSIQFNLIWISILLFARTSSFLSSTNSELRSSNLRMVEFSSATRLWFLLRSWNKKEVRIYHLTNQFVMNDYIY